MLLDGNGYKVIGIRRERQVLITIYSGQQEKQDLKLGKPPHTPPGIG
jgi:hypothetical protein